MKLVIIGTGYVGLVSGTCFADLGNDVTCIDIDAKKVERLQQGEIPIYEPGLGELVQRNLREHRLRFSDDGADAIAAADAIFLCVGTPQRHDGDADLGALLKAAQFVAEHLKGTSVVVVKSTVPVGTCERVGRLIAKHAQKDATFEVVSNPEFLREGAAVKDFQNPDRVVVGAESEWAREVMRRLYAGVTRIGSPLVCTDTKSSELIKYASNAMLATRISFMNELSHLCEAVGADIKEVAKGMGLDRRIGSRFLQAGAGYGGSCFPKDVRALAQTLEKHSLASNILMAIDYTNERQKKSLVPKLKRVLPDLDGARIAIWGVAFKPRTDDIREASALTIIEQLHNEYAEVVAYDPEAMENARKMLPSMRFGESMYACLEGADALIVVTEWDEFRQPDFERVRKAMRRPIIVDGRNIYDPDDIAAFGFTYIGVGRAAINASAAQARRSGPKTQH